MGLNAHKIANGVQIAAGTHGQRERKRESERERERPCGKNKWEAKG